MLTEKQIWDSDVLMAANSRAGMHMADFTALVRTVESVVTSRVETPLLARIAELEKDNDMLERYWNEAMSTHENINSLKERIAELEMQLHAQHVLSVEAGCGGLSKLAQVEQDAQPVARLLTWCGPAHYPVPHGGVAARTFAEFPKDTTGSYWKEADMLYTSPPKQVPLTITPVTQAMEMYAKHPTYRGERALSWLEAPQAVRDEWMAKAAHGIGTAAPAKTQGGES